jgi:DNA-directed RNA polymerase specialized sigma24 family protein
MNTSTDHDLNILASQDDREAFGELVRRFQSALFNVAYRMLGMDW